MHAAERPQSGLPPSLIPYRLYVTKGSVSAHLAHGTGFSDDDLKNLWEALANMWDPRPLGLQGHDGLPRVVRLQPRGTDSDADQRIRQAMLGCAPAQSVLDLGKVVDIDKAEDTMKKDGVANPHSSLTTRCVSFVTGYRPVWSFGRG